MLDSVRTIQGKEPGKQQREKAELERRRMQSGQDSSFIYMNQDSFTGTPLVVQWVRLCGSTARGGGMKILHTMHTTKNNKNQKEKVHLHPLCVKWDLF